MKKSYILLFFSFLYTFSNAQDFYDLNTIQTIKIVFSESNWDALLDAKKAGDESYLMAKSITINDAVFDSIGVKYKGNSTYNANQKKNPFHIELDTYKDQEYDGYTDIKLSNAANDPSFVREVLSYQILRQYMDAPLSNYANVYVNGTLIGLYSNSESVSKKFVKSRFGSKKNTFVKCNPPDGATPGSSSALPNLVYLGADSSKYYSAYEMQSDYGWDELINLCDTLTNNSSAIEKILDVDRALWMLAFDNALVNLDSYIGAFSQNYYLYRDDNKRFVPVVWDLNESFGRFSQTGSTNLNSTADKQKMSHLLNATSSSYPLLKMLLSVPMYKRMYLAHLKTFMLENFDDGSYYTTGQSLQTTIDASVQADVNKFFTYSNFKSNLTSDVSGGMGGPGSSTTPGITSLMNGRSTYLLALSDFTNAAPAISDISLSESSPKVNSAVTISGKVSGATAVYLGSRSNSLKPFTRVQMYDNGTNSDQTANDGIYSTSFTLENATTEYYIYAENSNAGMFSPQRAEHEFHTITATVGSSSESGVVINEFMASNESSVSDQDDEYDDWIELYNNTSVTVDLGGYYLSDDADELTQWEFPAGTSIGADSYLIVWADKDEEQPGLHANFKISATSGSLFLSDASGALIDEVTYTTQTTDISYARTPNGTGDFITMSPTYNATNTISTSVAAQQISSGVLAYPNPARNYFNLKLNGNVANGEKVIIYNSIGRIVFQDSILNEIQIDVANWTSGLYFIRSENSTIKMMVLK